MNTNSLYLINLYGCLNINKGEKIKITILHIVSLSLNKTFDKQVKI